MVQGILILVFVFALAFGLFRTTKEWASQIDMERERLNLGLIDERVFTNRARAIALAYMLIMLGFVIFCLATMYKIASHVH
jgi:hypothetical protein